jgi:hypothetical protein
VLRKVITFPAPGTSLAKRRIRTGAGRAAQAWHKPAGL